MRRWITLVVLPFVVFGTRYSTSQIKGLEAPGPSPELGDQANLFGQFIGNWECDVTTVKPDGSKEEAGKCDWNWGWILEGRAIQDVYIVHSPGAKPGSPAGEYGTTLRFYDPKIDAWHVIYVGPMHEDLSIFTARQVGNEIVLQGSKDDKLMGQWIFSETTKDSFHLASTAVR